MSSVTRPPPGARPPRSARPGRRPAPPPRRPTARSGGRPSSDRRDAARSRRLRRRSWLWRYRRLLFLVGLLASTALAGLTYLFARVPLPAEPVPAQTTFLTDVRGARLAELHGEENRVPVRLEQVPDTLRKAVISAEDRNFFRHRGVDPLGIARATWADVRGYSLQGGSTITQQYVKNTFVGRERTLVRKLREAVLAVKLERKYPKAQVLERYLNTIYLGRGAYGVQAAADAYFGKDVSQLDISESAYLASLIRSPEATNGGREEELIRGRRTRVLTSMERNGAITSEQRQAAERQPLHFVSLRQKEVTVARASKGTAYFVEYVRQRLLRRYPEDLILGGGLRVQTTLDLERQTQAYDSVTGVLDRPGDPDAALVALDSDGRVVAMVGGRNWEQSKVNLAVGADGGGRGRQGGSAFKPFVLAATLREGYSLESSFPGPPQLVVPRADNGKDWTVNNYEDETFDRINLVGATAHSVNTVYAQLVTALGPEKAADMAQALGIKSKLDAVPSIALGTQDVSVLEMAQAYLTFAKGGLRMDGDPTVVLKVTTADGTVLEEHRPRRTRVLDRTKTDMVNHTLRQVVETGTGTAAAFGKPVAGKTGTTDDYGDAWFVGYTPRLVAAVWMGYAEGQSKPMLDVHGKKVNGGSFPAVIFSRFMGKATKNDPATGFPAPPSFPGKILGARLGVGESTSTTGRPSSTSSTRPRAASPDTAPRTTVVPPTPTEPPLPPTTVRRSSTTTIPAEDLDLPP